MIDELANIWNIIAPYVAGGTLGGTILVSVVLILRAAICKKIDGVKESVNNKVIANDVSKDLLEKIKNISFEQNIQPLVESELKKVTEEANTYLKQQLKETQEGYNKLLCCVEKLAAYFDNSIGVSDEAKAELKQAIAEAKIPETPSNDFTTNVVVDEQPKEVTVEKKASKKKSAEIER